MAITITENTIKNATTYIPLLSKVAMARIGAQECVDTVKNIYRVIGNRHIGESSAAPPRWIENTLAKELYLMGVFMRYYLKLYDDMENISMAANEYDSFAESAVFNQLERLKSKTTDAEIKNKIFDMLYDFKQFQKMLGAEINGLLSMKNDTAARIFESMTAQMTPEALEKAGEEMKKLQDEIQQISEKINSESAEATSEDGE